MELIAPDGKISETFFPPKSFVILSINLSALNAEAGDYRRFFAPNKKFMRARPKDSLLDPIFIDTPCSSKYISLPVKSPSKAFNPPIRHDEGAVKLLLP